MSFNLLSDEMGSIHKALLVGIIVYIKKKLLCNCLSCAKVVNRIHFFLLEIATDRQIWLFRIGFGVDVFLNINKCRFKDSK